VAEVGKRLKAFEGKFHLPADSVPREDQRRTESEGLKRGQDNDVFGILQRLRLEGFPVTAGIASELFVGALDRFLGFAARTQASRNHAGRPWDRALPLPDLSRVP
jgi:hypothetical protein